MPTKERTKENCRSFDGADPRPRGCTPLGTPKRKSEVSAAKRTQYYCPFLTPPSLPPLLSRVLRGCERGATVERSETEERAMFAPCGANNRTSGPALLAGGARCAPPSAPEPPLWKWDVRRGRALLRPRRQGKAAAIPCPRMPTVVERPALRPPHAAFRMTLSFSRRGRRPRRPATIPLLPHNQKSGRWYITHHRSLLYCHACLNRLRNSTVLGFCGRSKMSAGVPSSQMTPSAM